MSLLDALEKDKLETFGPPAETTEKIEVVEKIEPEKNDPPVTNGGNDLTPEPEKTDPITQDPWFKKYQFENEQQAEEFINNSRNPKPEAAKPVFASSSVEEYNNFVGNGGPDDFQIFQTVKNFSTSENPAEEEMIKAIVTKRIIDDPDYKGKDALLEKSIRKEFGLNGELEHMDEDEKEERELNLIRLKKEYTKTSQAFKDLQSKTAPVKDEKLETHLKEAPVKLKEYLDKELSKPFEIKVPKIDVDKDGKEVVTEEILNSTIFDENMTKTYRNYYEGLSQGENYPDLGDGSKQDKIKTIAAGLTIAENLPKVFNKLWNDAVASANSKNTEEEIKETNPSVKGTHEKKATVVGADDTSENIFKRK